MTLVPGELAAETGRNNPYPGKLGVIEEGALADILIVDGNPLLLSPLMAGSRHLNWPVFLDLRGSSRPTAEQ